MGIELTTKSIGWEKICFNSFVEQGVDCDITLPDYCPEDFRLQLVGHRLQGIPDSLAGKL